MSFTTSEENYIKSIFHLQQETGLVNTNSLAAEMQTRAASVTDMLKKLKNKKLLQYEKYKGFKLNEAGKKAALDVVRKHRLWEYFLVEKLKLDWDKISFAFATADQSGTYFHSGYIEGNKVFGLSLNENRKFVLPWKGERKK